LTGTLPTYSFRPILSPYKFVYNSELPSTFDKKEVVVSPGKIIRAGGTTSVYEILFNKIGTIAKEQKTESIVVFLKDEETITKLKDYLAGMSCPMRILVLEEKMSDEAIYSTIQQAGESGRLILSTQFFARGTDFPNCGGTVKTTGGTLVIDTVVWELEADEIQAKGRTGRQDDPGKYLQLWHFDDIKEAFEITSEEEDGIMKELSGGGL
jgi:preprotein translocase subunit SecA